MPPSAAPPVAPAPIVVADRGDALAMLGAGVANLPLAAAATLDDAKRLVTEHTPLVLCDCHFDDGRMYDLLRWMKAGARLGGVPFLAIRMRQGELDDAMYESVKIATRALGADGFVDLYRWQQRYGIAPAAQRLMERITRLALGQPVSDPDSV